MALLVSAGVTIACGAYVHSVVLVLVPGLITSVLLFLAMLLQEREREGAERAASELRRSERSLRHSESRLHTLIERLPTAVSVYGEGRVVFCNPAMIAVLRGPGGSDIVGSDALDTVVEEDRDKLARALAACRRKSEESGPTAADESGPMLAGDGVPVDVRQRGAGGAVVQTEGFLLPIVFDGAPAVLGVWQDVTHKRQLAAHMMQMDRMIAVGTLAAGVAHEINNPLAYVMANLDFVLQELGSAARVAPDGGVAPAPSLTEITQALQEARDGAERMRRIVRDLRTYSRGDDDQRSASAVPIDVRRAVDWAVAIAANEVRQRARLVVTAEEVPLVSGDEGRLGQVFLNLLVNAAQAIPEGAAVKNEVRVATRGEAGRVIVDVSDTGTGIAPEHMGRIFDPFFTTKPVGVGTGLGLAIAQRIVTDHGGELTVRSETGQGTSFRIALPASNVQASQAAATDSRAATSAAAPLRRPRILVIDDELQVLRAIERGLATTHEVVPVARSQEALERLQSGERFDAILCDLMMPEMTGMDLHGQVIASMPEVARSMVFITGGAFTPRAREFLEHVPNAWVEKPFDLETLRKALQRAAAPTL